MWSVPENIKTTFLNNRLSVLLIVVEHRMKMWLNESKKETWDKSIIVKELQVSDRILVQKKGYQILALICSIVND